MGRSTSLKEHQRRRAAVEAHGGNLALAAESLGLRRTTLIEWQRQHGDRIVPTAPAAANTPQEEAAAVELIRNIALKLHARLPPSVLLEDLIQVGYFGYHQARKSFDPERGYQFATYGACRIRGAMLDWLRDQQAVSRVANQRAKHLLTLGMQLAQILGHPPTVEELSAHWGLPEDEVYLYLAIPTTKSLDQAIPNEKGKAESLREHLPDRNLEPVEIRQAKEEWFEGLTRGLRFQERLILYLYHICHLRMVDVANLLGMSESRVSQLHARAVAVTAEQQGQHGREEYFRQAASFRPQAL